MSERLFMLRERSHAFTVQGTPASFVSSDDSNLIPLINVVFLMLVFFMVAGQIRASDVKPVSPPLSRSEQTLQSTPELVINHEGQLEVDGKLFAVDQLSTWVAELRRDEASVLIRIRADASTSAQRLQEVLLPLRLSGVEKVELVTRIEAR